VNLSESYINRLKNLAGVISESKEKDIEWEYQIRDIGGLVFYKRKKGEETWRFTDAEDFAENACNSKIVKWKK
jgi:hypothetical protein